MANVLFQYKACVGLIKEENSNNPVNNLFQYKACVGLMADAQQQAL